MIEQTPRENVLGTKYVFGCGVSDRRAMQRAFGSDHWPLPSLDGAAIGTLQEGCYHDERYYLSGKRRSGENTTLRFEPSERSDDWRVRERTATRKEAQLLTYDDTSTLVPDTFAEIISDGESRTIFVGHRDGAVTRLKTHPIVEVRRIRAAPGSEFQFEGMVIDSRTKQLRLNSFDRARKSREQFGNVSRLLMT